MTERISHNFSQSDRLRVFISSRMRQLEDLRAILHRELNSLGIEAFVYEVDQGAHPDDPETVSLLEVERTDVLVLIIGDSYGEVTEREYDKAREQNKPCLVYERLGRGKTEEKLQRFIDKLSGPRGVPSRSTFQNAVDLAEKVAKDVQSWLVREYRRLSAEQLLLQESTRRKEQLEGSLKRLAASTSEPLPKGNPSDFLAWQLRQWFEALEYPLDVEPETGPNYTDLVVRVPARRQYSNTLVRAVAGEIQSPDVDIIQLATKERNFDEIWLVSLRRISPAAKEASKTYKNLYLYTLDELIEEDINFDRYFEWLNAQIQAADIDRLYVPLAVTINEIDSTGVFRSASTYEDISTYVDQWMEDTDGEHLSLLGEFGTGKSWFSLKYAHDLVNKYKDAQKRGLARPRVPLVVRLREYARGFKDVGALLTEFIFREHQLNIRSFTVLETLNRMGRLLFIFDGFDEMAARVDQQKIVDNFWSLASVLSPGSKAILTCRTEYFQYSQQAREVLSGRLRSSSMRELYETARFQVATLQMFDEQRLRQVLCLRSNDEDLINAVITNQKLFDLGRRPVMVDLLIEAMPSLEAQNADLATVYYQAVWRKMERDITLGRTFTSLADKIFFMCEISWEMLSTRQLKINYKQIPDRIRDYFGARVATAEEDHWRHDLLSQTMLVRDDEGYYRPAHKSFIEFFSAYKLAAAIGALRAGFIAAAREQANISQHLQASPQQWSVYFRAVGPGAEYLAPLSQFAKESPDELEKTWGNLSLDDATSELIYLLCGPVNLLTYLKTQNCTDEIESIVAARVLEVMSFFKELKGIDLSGISLSGCQLHNCSLEGANFSNSIWNVGTIERVSFDYAILHGTHFKKNNFADVTFRRTDLSNSQFDETVQFQVNVVGGVWCSMDEKEILLIILADKRLIAIIPQTLEIEELGWPDFDVQRKTAEELTLLLEHKGILKFPGFGTLTLTGSGWRRNNAWQNRKLLNGVTSKFEAGDTGPGGDVSYLDIEVLDQITNGVLLRTRIYDATLVGKSYLATRALVLSTNGKYLAAVRGAEASPEKAIIISERGCEIELVNFIGNPLKSGPDTIDNRGAAFSPSTNFIAICERSNAVGIWQTNNGEFVGRIVLYPAAKGCVLNGTTGLPPMFISANENDKDGFIIETA